VANDYTLCLYDALGRRLQVTAPADTSCGAEPCWKETGTGFKYKDKAGSADGIIKLSLKSGDIGEGKDAAQGAWFSQHAELACQ
jgi:hypothetical protein